MGQIDYRNCQIMPPQQNQPVPSSNSMNQLIACFQPCCGALKAGIDPINNNCTDTTSGCQDSNNECPQKKLYSYIKAELGFKGGCCGESRLRENSFDGGSESSKLLQKLSRSMAGDP